MAWQSAHGWVFVHFKLVHPVQVEQGLLPQLGLLFVHTAVGASLNNDSYNAANCA